jgi:hypothetical protein
MPGHPKQSISHKKKYSEQRKTRIGAPRKKKRNQNDDVVLDGLGIKNLCT